MTTRLRFLRAGTLCVSLVLSITTGFFDRANAAPPPGFTPFVGPVDRAVCVGTSDRPETGIQGRTRAAADIASGRAALGYSCNLEQVGHTGTAALWQMAWFEDCAYYGIGAGFGGVTGGTNVVDASNPATPVITQTLRTPAMTDPWESLKVNHKRGLLGAVGPGIGGPGGFDVYDVNRTTGPTAHNCASPLLQSVLPVDAIGHEGEWAADGLTYWGSGAAFGTMTAIDVSNPLAPRPVVTLNAGGIHGFSVSDDGTRLYGANISPNGLETWDVSAIQNRDTAPASSWASLATAITPAVVNRISWTDGGTAQMTIPITIKGHKFLVFIDEAGGGNPQTPGMARIIDIEDEANPFIVSYLRDEINMPGASSTRSADGGGSGFTYQGHYCGVPRRDDPEVLACSYFWQGIRVFDIRDPYHPREIAYFSPGKTSGTGTSSKIRFLKRKGRAELWFTDQNKGFYVVKFTGGWPFGTATIDAAGVSMLSEGASAGTLTAKLGQQPNGDTVVRLTPVGGLTVSPDTLTFTRANYDAPQSVMVAATDAFGSGSRTGKVTARVISEGGLPPGNPDETGISYDLARDPHYMDGGGVVREVPVAIASNDAALTFLQRDNVAPSTFVTTEARTVCCFPGSLPIGVSNGQYSINGGAFTNVAGSIPSGSTLALRHVSAGATNAATSTTVTVGDYSTDFRSVTSALDRAPDPFDFGTVNGVEPSTLVQSGTQMLTGFNTGTPIVAGPGVSYSIDGGTFTSATGTLQPGQTLQVQQTSSATRLAYTKGYVKVGGVYGYFTTRSK